MLLMWTNRDVITTMGIIHNTRGGIEEERSYLCIWNQNKSF